MHIGVRRSVLQTRVQSLPTIATHTRDTFLVFLCIRTQTDARMVYSIVRQHPLSHVNLACAVKHVYVDEVVTWVPEYAKRAVYYEN